MGRCWLLGTDTIIYLFHLRPDQRLIAKNMRFRPAASETLQSLIEEFLDYPVTSVSLREIPY